MGIAERSVFLHDAARIIDAVTTEYKKLEEKATELSAALQRLADDNGPIITEINNLGDVSPADVLQKDTLSQLVTEFTGKKAVIDAAVTYLNGTNINVG